MKKEIYKGMVQGLSFFLTIGICFISYAAWTNISTRSDGQTMTATYWNELVNTINTIGNTYVPTGAIMAFNLGSCPTGWAAADGTNGTPDLRGQFLRGINSFDNGGTTRSDGKQDPDCTLRSSGVCNVGSSQNDDYKSHNHKQHDSTMYNYTPKYFNSLIGAGVDVNLGVYMSFNTFNSGGNETRPKNVGVIFCIKQ